MISEKPLKLRGDGGGTVSFVAPFDLERGLFGGSLIETRSFAMKPRGYASLTTLIKVRRLRVVAPRKDSPEPDIVTIKEAASLLGVSEPTLRRWDDAGKFKARRHPINGYRLYDRGKVLAMRKKILGKAA